MTIPSPSMMHFRGGREAIDAESLSRTWTSSTPIWRASIARRWPISAPPAAGICRSTRSISPISATPKLRAQVRNIGEDPEHAAEDLCRAVQRHDRRQAGRHGGLHASLPRQFRRRLGRRGRLRPDGRGAVQRDRRRRLFPRIRLATEPAVSRRCASCRRAKGGAGARHHQEPALESKDELKRRIDEAARYAPAGAARFVAAMRLLVAASAAMP